MGKILHRLRKSYHSSLRSLFILPVLFASINLCTTCKNQTTVSGPPEKITIAYSTVHKDMPNYLDFIYVDGLLAVRPEAVRILR